MGKASSAKKVARAARAGGRTTQGPKRNLAFPAAIAAIIVVGALLVVFARGANQDRVAASPRVGDHIHAAYGVYVCDAFLPPLQDIGPDTTGLHTHGDGVAHIHPFANGASGSNATLAKFGEMVGLTFSSDGFTVNGTEYTNGYDCGGQPAQISLYVWPADDPDAEPEVLTGGDIGDFRLDTDREVMTLAVVPEGTDVPRPESAPELDSLSDVIQAPTDSTLPPSSTPTPSEAPPASTEGTPSSDTTAPGETTVPATEGEGAPPTTVAP
jgi:hypothetical protein